MDPASDGEGEGEGTLRSRLELAQKAMLENVRSGFDEWESILRTGMTPGFIALPSFDESPLDASSLDSHVQNITIFLAANPDYQIEVTSQSTSIYSELEQPLAVTYATVHISGLESKSSTVSREAVIIFYWRLADDSRWWAYKQVVLRGPGAMGI